MLGGSLPLAAALLVRMTAGRGGACALIYIFFFLTLFEFPERRVGVGFFGGSFNRRRRFWYAYQRVGRASALVFSLI